jgi:protein-disulfide isomerase-like protein with CxxC motif
MKTEEMNKGVQILLERVKSNPEEFTPDITGRYPDKWRVVLQQVEGRANDKSCRYLDFLSDAEIAEVWRAIQDVRGDQFTKQVMNTLLRDGELSFTSDLGIGETPNLKKLLKENKARDVVTRQSRANMELLNRIAGAK